MSGSAESQLPIHADTVPTSSASRRGFLRGRQKAPTTRFVGIQFGIPDVRVVTLQPSGSKSSDEFENRYEWTSSHRFSLPIDASAALTPATIDRTIGLLCDSLPRCVDGEKNLASLSLPPAWIHYENSPIEAVVQNAAHGPSSGNVSRVSAETQLRCDQMFASSAFRSHASLSHWPISQSSSLQMIAATASETACKIADGIVGAGYQMQSILPHGVALATAASAMTSLQPGCILMLERIGGLVAITREGRCGLCRSLPSRPPELDNGRGARSLDAHSLSTWIDDVVSETNATLKYAARNQCDVESDAVVMLCGELADIDGLDTLLANRLQKPVAKWTYSGESAPAIHCNATGHTDQDASQPTGYPSSQDAVALSLAYAAALQASVGRARESKQ